MSHPIERIHYVKKPGHNVDLIDIKAGLKTLSELGYDDPHTRMVIEYNLARWGRGEEEAATKAATDKSFYGIDLTGWYRVLAASRAAAENKSFK